MKANELKIGNIVSIFGIEQHIITELKDTIYVDLNPIPLTEEWLLKFGFEKKIGWDDLIYHVKNNVDLYEFLSGYEYYDFHIKHVHQLQNLYFALTGEELKIKDNEQRN